MMVSNATEPQISAAFLLGAVVIVSLMATPQRSVGEVVEDDQN